MDIKLPNELDWVLDLLGFQWPNIDIDTLIDAAQEWTDFGAAVQEFAQSGNTAASAVTAVNSGDAVDAFVAEWGKFGDGGLGVGYLDLIYEASIVLAGLLSLCAGIIAAMKIAIIVQLIDLAIEFAVAQASAVVTLGASEAALAGRIVMIRMVVKRIFTEAVQKIGEAVRKAISEYAVKKATDMAKDLAKDTAKEFGKALGSQLTQLSLGGGMQVEALAKGAVNPALKTFTGTKWGDDGLEADGVGKVATGAIQAGKGIAEGDAGKAWEGYQTAVKGARDGIGSRYDEPGQPSSTTQQTGDGGGEPTTGGDGGGGEPATGGDGGGGEPAAGGDGGGGEPATGGDGGGGEPAAGSGGESGSGTGGEGSGSGSGGASARAVSEDDNARATFG
ncbi:hypothetical protein OG785_10100 [Streptomyces sp. NBC_00006]|uniref:WXG100-like domain-containing protein n=1 Tax=unclassified Streptomyces TaxID=2593676 RepID=UPI0022541913|nr:hypothetical protein [Streptomyces sp. NBC_00006]MCX5530910.1 hypothetical protein [Streptomyces sp. NBC_00006]